jgi:hypothetical protein
LDIASKLTYKFKPKILENKCKPDLGKEKIKNLSIKNKPEYKETQLYNNKLHKKRSVMPYINEEERQELDYAIDQMVDAIRNSKCSLFNPHDFANYLGRINYCFSRVIMGVMKTVSYKNIAMATGVLENIKQELYRRAASSYEDQKILANGDIPEYKKLR